MWLSTSSCLTREGLRRSSKLVQVWLSMFFSHLWYVQLCFTNSSTIYAAKIFYNIGTESGTVSVEDNLQLLKEELLCQVAIQAAVNAFNKAAEEAKVVIYGEPDTRLPFKQCSHDFPIAQTCSFQTRLSSRPKTMMKKCGLSTLFWILLGWGNFRGLIKLATILILLERLATPSLTLRWLIPALNLFLLTFKVCTIAFELSKCVHLESHNVFVQELIPLSSEMKSKVPTQLFSLIWWAIGVLKAFVATPSGLGSSAVV